MTSPLVVDLPEALTIANAEALHEQLEPALSAHQNVFLNAEHVSRVDTAGLQLLFAFNVELNKHELTLDWSDVPSVLRESAELIGLKGLLSLH